MKWTSGYKHAENLSFIIDEDKNVGFYLYVYDQKGSNTHDYLQDTLDAAQDDAWEYFGVPIDSWVEIDDRQP